MQHKKKKSIVTQEPILMKFGFHTRTNQSNMLQSNFSQKNTLKKGTKLSNDYAK